MPRSLPPLASQFDVEVSRADDLISRLETASIEVAQIPGCRHLLHVSKLELVYELAFLRVFLAWENFLEQTFLRFLCGYQHSGGQESLITANYYKTLDDAEKAILGQRQFALWHNPDHVIQRAQRFFTNGRHETIISSSQPRLQYFAAIRHRIAHSQEHARSEFDKATMTLCGKRYPGSRPGKFLRDQDAALAPPIPWLEAISHELSGLAHQISA